MRHAQSSALPETAYYTPERRPPASRRPFVERIAGWSARHRKTAVFGWLLLVAAIFVAGQALGSKNLPSYDAGQAGQAERTLHQFAPARRRAGPGERADPGHGRPGHASPRPAMRQRGQCATRCAGCRGARRIAQIR